MLRECRRRWRVIEFWELRGRGRVSGAGAAAAAVAPQHHGHHGRVFRSGTPWSDGGCLLVAQGGTAPWTLSQTWSWGGAGCQHAHIRKPHARPSQAIDECRCSQVTTPSAAGRHCQRRCFTAMPSSTTSLLGPTACSKVATCPHCRYCRARQLKIGTSPCSLPLTKGWSAQAPFALLILCHCLHIAACVSGFVDWEDAAVGPYARPLTLIRGFRVLALRAKC